MAHIVQLIFTQEYRGVGTEDDKCRNVPQLWTLDGHLVCEHDPAPGDRGRHVTDGFAMAKLIEVK